MMIILRLIFALTIFNSCISKSGKKDSADFTNRDTIRIHDTIYINTQNTIDWQKGFGLTHDPEKDSIWFKPVSYYLDDKECSALAFDFYYGYIRPSDNGTTTELLKLAISENAKLRPLYRWCLNKTLQVSDGALTELVGVPARQYAEKFPEEFFEYVDFEPNNNKYDSWVGAIIYSGFFDFDDNENYKLNRQKLEQRMLKNLKTKNIKNIERVKKFAMDCAAI